MQTIRQKFEIHITNNISIKKFGLRESVNDLYIFMKDTIAYTLLSVGIDVIIYS